MTEPDVAALFDLDALPAAPTPPGPAELGLRAALAGAAHLIAEDAALIGSALQGARALDAAGRRLSDPKAGYLVAALLTPYRETCAALRLPAAIAPADGPSLPGENAQAPDWESVFGRPE